MEPEAAAIKPRYYRNFIQSGLAPKTLEGYDEKLRRYMQYLGIQPSATVLTSTSASLPTLKKKRRTKPSSFNVPDYTDIDYAKLIEGKSVNQIEDEISKFIDWQKEHHYARQSQTHYLSAISKFYSRNRVTLNKDWLWGCVSKEDVIVINTDEDMERQEDRGYTREEISKLLEFCKSLRTRVMILLMASTGMRLGSLPKLRFGDLNLVPEHNLYQIHVDAYSKEDHYFTFCNPECRKVIENYLDNRRRDGERITKSSPLLRAEYNTRLARDDWECANKVKPISEPTVKRCISQVLYDSGLRTPLAIDPSVSLNNRRAVPMDHGFRRFFGTSCRHAGVHDDYVKWLSGRELGGSEDAYFLPQPDSSGIYRELLEGNNKKAGYLDAIDWLTIDNSKRLQRENEMLKVKKSEYESLKEQLEQYKNSQDYIAGSLEEIRQKLRLEAADAGIPIAADDDEEFETMMKGDYPDLDPDPD
jgi:integrase